jgi:hypothetical protein
MLVKDRMSPQPVTVGPDDTLAHALRLTRAHRVRHLPVVGSDQLLAGIVSDRDIRLAMPSPLTVNVLPCPGWLCKRISPPSRRDSSRTNWRNSCTAGPNGVSAPPNSGGSPSSQSLV